MGQHFTSNMEPLVYFLDYVFIGLYRYGLDANNAILAEEKHKPM